MRDKTKLVRFLKSLKDEGIIDFDKDSFVHRLKLQKYVFIAQKLGFHTNYNYSLYIHGPYSTSLADDYYSIGNFDSEKPTRMKSKFVKITKNKSKKWLELAATIIMIKERHDTINHNKLIDLVKSAKPLADKDYLLDIIRELEKYNCFN